MALILSIETSTRTSSIALHEDGGLISSQHIHIEKSHAQYLTQSIKYLVETSGLTLEGIEAVAISKGPGSYTGLRIGTSTAKGICYGLNAKLIAINSLEAMAYGMAKLQYESTLLCPMIDARRMEVYCLVATKEMSIVKSTQAIVIEKNTFDDLLADNKIIFFGNGALKCKSILKHSVNAIFIDNLDPSAESIGELAWKAYRNQQFEDIAYFEPYYLKDFIAKKPSGKNLV